MTPRIQKLFSNTWQYSFPSKISVALSIFLDWRLLVVRMVLHCPNANMLWTSHIRLGILALKPVDFPMEQNHSLSLDNNSLLEDPGPYRRLVGRLITILSIFYLNSSINLTKDIGKLLYGC